MLASSLFLPGCAPPEQIQQKPKQDYTEIALTGYRTNGNQISSQKSYHIKLDKNGNPKAITHDFGDDPIVAPGYEKEFPNSRRMSEEQYEQLKKLTKANSDFIYKLELNDFKRNK